MQYSPVSIPRHSPQLLPCHRHPQYYQQPHRLTLDLHQGPSTAYLDPTTGARSLARTQASSLGSTPITQGDVLGLPKVTPPVQIVSGHSPSSHIAPRSDFRTQVISPDNTPPTRDPNSPAHSPKAQVLPGITPKSYMVDGEVQNFYSSEEWRWSLEAEERRGSGQRRPSGDGGAPGWLNTQPDRPAPTLTHLHPHHHHHHDCSAGVFACDEEVKALLRLSHLTAAPLAPLPPPPPASASSPAPAGAPYPASLQLRHGTSTTHHQAATPPQITTTSYQQRRSSSPPPQVSFKVP